MRYIETMDKGFNPQKNNDKSHLVVISVLFGLILFLSFFVNN